MVWEKLLPWCVWSGKLHKGYNYASAMRVCCVSPFLLNWFVHNSSRLFPCCLTFPILLQGLRTLFGMHRVGKTPVLFCSLHNSNCIRLLDLPSWVHKNFSVPSGGQTACTVVVVLSGSLLKGALHFLGYYLTGSTGWAHSSPRRKWGPSSSQLVGCSSPETAPASWKCGGGRPRTRRQWWMCIHSHL